MSAPSMLMSIKTASIETDLSEYTIRKAINEGELQAVRIGASIRIRPVELETWIAGIEGKS
jgi:excisionase family DNA binding protein